MGQGQSQGFDPAHVRIYTNLLKIREAKTRYQMMTTVLQSPEYVATARRAGIYAHMLAYINAVERGLDLPPLPGEYAPHQAQSGGTVPHLRAAVAQQQQVTVRQGQQRNPVQVLAKKKASEKAMSFFQSSLRFLCIEENLSK